MKTSAHDAINLLIKDHQEVKQNFKKFEDLSSRAKVGKKKLADEICHALLLHMKIEEEIFYPVARKALKENELLDEAVVEHAGAKDLIAQIMQMEPGEALYDAKMKVLSEQIEHHVKEEEQEMFPRLRKTGIDLIALGEVMKLAKEEAESTLFA